MENVKVYGIKNCDTMKRTFKFLEENKVDYSFIDYKKTPPTKELLNEFLEEIPLDKLVNKKGMTFRKLSDEEKESLKQEDSAIPLIIKNSSMIKRPVMVFPDGRYLVGFQPDEILEK
ncbi:Spx/MgsR family RNA polymerase-binding regulatory protein [Echinicola jeungdonensis]|uniref:Spx/MgsR family RNA polymerase-binding regulatory protein n=1 Tax=Echinicola jeungdonensis TaxID=709343 RepID=A0ABV5J3A0_9BACT|nr:Spx/MgsR family RNA polymerase-binding regulatory protein [Echinicola jeungdonensis]MDN3668308.1 Spx/MgsR family RNA polymerase-binding regulatory protein [Echinicola jeungdonensis]